MLPGSRSTRHGVWIIPIALLLIVGGAPPPAAATTRATQPAPGACAPGVPQTPGAECPPTAPPTRADGRGLPRLLGPDRLPGAAALPPANGPDAETKAGGAGGTGAQPEIAALAAGMQSGGYLTCGTLNAGGWTTTAPTFQTIASCTLTVPEDGVVYMSASASVGLADAAYEAAFSLSIDDPAGNNATDRRVDVYSDKTAANAMADGTDKSVADTLLAPIKAGAHTFFFLGSRSGGGGTVQLYRPSLSVLYVPKSNAEVRTCGAAGDMAWSSASGSFQPIRTCTLNVPTRGVVFVNGSGWLAPAASGPYQARIRLGIDSPDGLESSDRIVSVYSSAGTGSDEMVDTTQVLPLEPGQHQFSLLGLRLSGAGSVQLNDATLSVLFFPVPSVTAKTCGATSGVGYLSNSTDFATFSFCTLYIPTSGPVFIDASAWMGLKTDDPQAWEGEFRLAIDNNPRSEAVRWLNVYNDATLGSDRTLGISGIFNVTRGMHTFSLIGKRFAQSGTTGTMVVWTPSISVIAPSAPPEIRAIPNQTVPQNLPTETIPFTFTTWLGPDKTTVTGRAANRALVPDANIAIGGSGENRTVTITPTHDLAGITPITITASDGVVTATQTFTLTVVAPQISPIPNQIVLRNQTLAPIPFTIVSGDDPYAVKVTARSSNVALVPDANITLGGAGPNRTIRIVPAPNVFGRTTITLTLQDAASTASTTFTVTVTDYRIAFVPRATR